MGASFHEVILTSQGVNLVVTLLGALAVYLILRFLDWLAGIKFTDHIQIIDDSPQALAIYRGLRFVAVAYFIATLLK